MNKGGFGGRYGGDPKTTNPNKLRAVKLDKSTRNRVLLRLAKYLFSYRLTVLLAIAIMLASNVLALLAPKLSGYAINALRLGEGRVDFDAVWTNAGLMLACYVASALLSFCLSVILVSLGQRITYTLRRELFEHLMRLPVGYFDRHATGDIISHISYDIDTINTSLSHDLLQICSGVITVLGSLIFMLTISPTLVLVFAVTVPLSFVWTKYITGRVRPLFRERSGKLGWLNGYAEEMLSGQRSIRIYGREKVILDRFEERNKEMSRVYYNADYANAMLGPSVNFINNLSLSLIILVGGMFFMLSLTGAVPPVSLIYLELGSLSSFVDYSRKFAGPINEFANILADLQSALAAAERVFRILDTPPEDAEDKNTAELASSQGEVELEHVRFGYDESRVVLTDLNLKVKPGDTVAIVGPTGAGKTTIINLLMRFYDVNSGEVRVDGEDIRELTRGSLRRAYTMVLQETWLFGGTIAENIAYGKEGATMDEIVAAAKAAKIHSYIKNLPSGYDTVLSDNGSGISKGQKQLITIARAMLSDAPMLILDEATSNVDSRTERQIQEAMLRLMQGRTCFVIAHRLSTIQNADVILVLKDGNVIEQGDHGELMARGGFYATLYNSQFS